ncbi:MAG: ATP-binding protein [Hyphomicrobium sp.]
MSQTRIFDSETPLPDNAIAKRQKTLLGFEARYVRVRNQLRLLLQQGELAAWSQKHHKAVLPICELVSEQYPLAIFHGDVGTGKTATAECIANRLIADARVQDCVLFKLSNRVRGTGKVGEMGSLLLEAFHKVTQSAGKSRSAMLIIDEGDSLAASRTQEHAHHEDKVAVNTLIQCIDEMRRLGGRVVVFLCTNRLGVLDAAMMRRAAIVEEFKRPDDRERLELLMMDLVGLGLNDSQIKSLVAATGGNGSNPGWTYSDIRTRLYPAALASAFPDSALRFEHFLAAAEGMTASPVLEDR